MPVTEHPLHGLAEIRASPEAAGRSLDAGGALALGRAAEAVAVREAGAPVAPADREGGRW
jgi:hypothetical protein